MLKCYVVQQGCHINIGNLTGSYNCQEGALLYISYWTGYKSNYNKSTLWLSFNVRVRHFIQSFRQGIDRSFSHPFIYEECRKQCNHRVVMHNLNRVVTQLENDWFPPIINRKEGSLEGCIAIFGTFTLLAIGVYLRGLTISILLLRAPLRVFISFSNPPLTCLYDLLVCQAFLPA